jgi:hypothetical protein
MKFPRQWKLEIHLMVLLVDYENGRINKQICVHFLHFVQRVEIQKTLNINTPYVIYQRKRNRSAGKADISDAIP